MNMLFEQQQQQKQNWNKTQNHSVLMAELMEKNEKLCKID